MSLQLSQALELRQRMETTLLQELSVKQELKISLDLYRKREGVLTKLYRTALRRGMVKRYAKHGMEFEYALVRIKDIPEDLREYGMGFSHCLCRPLDLLFFGKAALAEGSWLLFVVDDMYPTTKENYLEYVAVHERGEQVTLGDHNLASKLEFAIAKEENSLLEYMHWIEENYSGKFADVFSYQTRLELPESEEFRRTLEASVATEEARKVRTLIEGFQWPYKVPQRLILYKRKNEEIAGIITRALRLAEVRAEQSGMPIKTLIEKIRGDVAAELYIIRAQGLARYMNLPRLESIWREGRIAADRAFVKMLGRRRAISQDFLEELFEADVRDALPDDGVLSLSLKEVIRALP